MTTLKFIFNFHIRILSDALIKMLDLGAGDGGITRKFKPFFEHIEATEMSQVHIFHPVNRPRTHCYINWRADK